MGKFVGSNEDRRRSETLVDIEVAVGTENFRDEVEAVFCDVGGKFEIGTAGAFGVGVPVGESMSRAEDGMGMYDGIDVIVYCLHG